MADFYYQLSDPLIQRLREGGCFNAGVFLKETVQDLELVARTIGHFEMDRISNLVFRENLPSANLKPMMLKAYDTVLKWTSDPGWVERKMNRDWLPLLKIDLPKLQSIYQKATVDYAVDFYHHRPPHEWKYIIDTLPTLEFLVMFLCEVARHPMVRNFIFIKPKNEIIRRLVVQDCLRKVWMSCLRVEFIPKEKPPVTPPTTFSAPPAAYQHHHHHHDHDSPPPFVQPTPQQQPSPPPPLSSTHPASTGTSPWTPLPSALKRSSNNHQQSSTPSKKTLTRPAATPQLTPRDLEEMYAPSNSTASKKKTPATADSPLKPLGLALPPLGSGKKNHDAYVSDGEVLKRRARGPPLSLPPLTDDEDIRRSSSSLTTTRKAKTLPPSSTDHSDSSDSDGKSGFHRTASSQKKKPFPSPPVPQKTARVTPRRKNLQPSASMELLLENRHSAGSKTPSHRKTHDDDDHPENEDEVRGSGGNDSDEDESAAPAENEKKKSPNDGETSSEMSHHLVSPSFLSQVQAN